MNYCRSRKDSGFMEIFIAQKYVTNGQIKKINNFINNVYKRYNYIRNWDCQRF